MREGDVLAGRFLIERLAGSGGMGTVYRAVDRATSGRVAIKVLHLGAAGDVTRFEQEARVLERLSHPAIVRYVAHGNTDEGHPFLAIEWLDGEDLAARLRRAPLQVAEVMTLARRIAAGLGAAHAEGVIHRDVKPSNLFLPDRDPARALLLDFGVARCLYRTQALTHAGALLGTVGYMAPEQAGGTLEVGPPADIFSLGCALFECLAGVPAFPGDTAVAVLAKVLWEPPPRLYTLRPDVPPALDDLVAKMLDKDPRHRPAHGAALLEALEALGQLSGAAPRGPDTSREPLTAAEQRFVSVMLVDVAADVEPTSDTLPADHFAAEREAVVRLVRRHRGDVRTMGSTAVLVVLDGTSAAGDQAAASAACALQIAALHPRARIVLATGRAETTGQWPTGPVIDRAAALFARDRSAGIEVDPVTAQLLEARYQLEATGPAMRLAPQGRDLEQPRPLLGRATPCVGRDKELQLLEATWQECKSEPVARAVVVTAPAGTGKSRLRQELVMRIRAAGDATVWLVRADAVGAASPLAIMRRLIGRAAELRDSDPPETSWARLVAHLEAVGAGEPAWIADFLGEVANLPARPSPSPQLRASQHDPDLMRGWMKKSVIAWLDAACRHHPTLIVLEDLHWGDTASVGYLDAALRELAHRPLMVVALGRPELVEVFPRLWSETAQALRLAGLTRKAGERLVIAVLGDSVDPQVVSRLLDRAEGNAFYLEELIRRVAEGARDLPESVLAMVQSRLEALPAEARRVLRAASVFGEVFWQGAVTEVLGGAVDVPGWLRRLAERELLVMGRGERFPGEPEWAFRHGLLREAAYATITDTDRIASHRRAADWLQAAGEKDAAVMAEHLQLGGQAERACTFIVRAAEASVLAGDVRATVRELRNRAASCGASDAVRGQLLTYEGAACSWANDMPAALALQREALELLPPGSPMWLYSAASANWAAMALGDSAASGALLGRVMQLETQPAPTGSYGVAMFVLVSGLFSTGQKEMVLALKARMEQAELPSGDPSFLGYLMLVRLLTAQYEPCDMGGRLVYGRRALELFESAGNTLACSSTVLVHSWALADAGRSEDAERLLDAVPPAGVFGKRWYAYSRARNRVLNGRPAEALEAAAPLYDAPDAILALGARTVRAAARLMLGDAVEAEREAREIIRGTPLVVQEALALGVLSRAALAQGRRDEAIAFADRGLQLPVNATLEGSYLHLARADAGGPDDSAARDRARDRLTTLAATLIEPDRAGFFATDLHARTLAP